MTLTSIVSRGLTGGACAPAPLPPPGARSAPRNDYFIPRDELARLNRQQAQQRARLARITGQADSAQTQAAKNTISGTGTYIVGSDIQPGTYRAAAQPGCYWARLSSLNTSDIIDNDNADGPVVVQIQGSDKAFKANGCADFHRAS